MQRRAGRQKTEHLQEVRRVRNSMFNLVKDRSTRENFQRGKIAEAVGIQLLKQLWHEHSENTSGEEVPCLLAETKEKVLKSELFLSHLQ